MTDQILVRRPSADAGFAEKYIVSGCVADDHCGTFVRDDAHQCNGAPTYRRDGVDGAVGLYLAVFTREQCEKHCAQGDTACQGDCHDNKGGKTQWYVSIGSEVTDCVFPGTHESNQVDDNLLYSWLGGYVPAPPTDHIYGGDQIWHDRGGQNSQTIRIHAAPAEDNNAHGFRNRTSHP